MADDDDFTFCRVGPPVDDVEVQNVANDVNGIHIDAGNYNPSDGGRIWKMDALARKEETVSSLSFTVIDASTRKERDQQTKLKGKEPSGSSDMATAGVKNPVRKPAPRAKVPFEKGYSQVDWLKLTRTHPDLAGLNGQSNRRLISLKEVKQNQSGSAMWTVLKGRVYNIAPYMKFHPGGLDMLMKAVGKDCTSLFNKYHAWVNAEFLMEKCLVGILDTDQ